MGEHTFICVDGAGEKHHYDCALHRGGEGMPIVLRLSALVIEPLVSAAGPAVVEALGKKGKASLKGFDLETLDFPKIAATLREVLMALPPALIHMILRYTNRDEQPLIGSDGKPTAHFDVAYSANYVEIARAVWEVCKVNAFFPGLGTLQSVGGKALAAAQEIAASAN